MKKKPKIALYGSNLQKLRGSFKLLLDNFYTTFQNASLPQRKILLHFLFPAGLIWDYDEWKLKTSLLKAEKAVIDQRNKEAFETLVEPYGCRSALPVATLGPFNLRYPWRNPP